MSESNKRSLFDETIDRREVPALKFHPRVLGHGGEHLFAAGVADMDIKAAPPVLDALQRRLDHGVFGYEAVPDGLLPSLVDWLEARHGRLWTDGKRGIVTVETKGINQREEEVCYFKRRLMVWKREFAPARSYPYDDQVFAGE